MARHQTSFLFDLDGTLVDSVYQHVLAWREALDEEGIELSVWRIHRKIGMSGGLFTNMLLRETGLEIEEARIERLRRLHAESYKRRSGQVRPLPGARELLTWEVSSQSLCIMVLSHGCISPWLHFDPRSEPICMTKSVSQPVQPHIRSPFEAAAPISRVRRFGLRRTRPV
jgi:beta-phosphoglucomutase-like phosphatase (HAD superfamily)